MRLALTFYSVLKMPIEDIIYCSKEAERAGFEYISFAESFYRDVSVLGSAIACNTTKIKFGTSIYPISTRTPFQIAMSTATLNELSRGRVGFIGLGVGYKSRIEQYFGVKVEKSLRKMREYIQIIRGLLSGESFSYHGRYFDFYGFPKLVPERLQVPILLGTSAPRMLHLSGESADGVVLNSIGTTEYFAHAISKIHEGAESARRKKSDLEIAASVIFSVSDKQDDALNAARPDVLFYLLYQELDPVIERTRYVQKVNEIREVNSQGDAKRALSMVSDEMVSELSIAGTPQECRQKIKELANLGITLPVVRVSVQPSRENERKDIFLKAIESLSHL